MTTGGVTEIAFEQLDSILCVCLLPRHLFFSAALGPLPTYFVYSFFLLQHVLGEKGCVQESFLHCLNSNHDDDGNMIYHSTELGLQPRTICYELDILDIDETGVQ